MKNILEVSNLCKQYTSAGKPLNVLREVSFSIPEGEVFSIVGASGSGKTTLLGLCAGLDRPTSGAVVLNGVSIEKLSEDQRAALRNDCVGFIFQNFQLLPTLTAIENVMVPLELKGKKKCRDIAYDLLAKVGLSDRSTHYPAQLSGGEQQRISLARAFANDPKILFADEPTGNLDEDTGKKVEELLFSLNKAMKTTLVLVTHNPELAQKTDRTMHLKGGEVLRMEIHKPSSA